MGTYYVDVYRHVERTLIAGATVCLGEVQKVSDSNGRTTWELIDYQQYTFEAAAEGYQTRSSEVMAHPDYPVVAGFYMVEGEGFFSEGSFLVRFKDANTGVPLQGVSTIINGVTRTSNESGELWSGFITTGHYDLIFSKDGYEDYLWSMTLGETSTSYPFWLMVSVEPEIESVVTMGMYRGATWNSEGMVFETKTNNFDVNNIGVIGNSWNVKDYAIDVGEAVSDSRAEIVLVSANILNVHTALDVKIEWRYTDDTRVLYTYNHSIPAPASGYYYPHYSLCSWIGYFPHEIDKNGIYYVYVTYGGLTKKYSYTVTGLPIKLKDNISIDSLINLSGINITQASIKLGVSVGKESEGLWYDKTYFTDGHGDFVEQDIILGDNLITRTMNVPYVNNETGLSDVFVRVLDISGTELDSSISKNVVYIPPFWAKDY